jgi:hypothetical protein
MPSSDLRWVSALAAAVVALSPASAEAQTTVRSFEELLPSAVVVDEAAQGTRSSLRPVARGWLERAADREVSRLARLRSVADSTRRARQQTGRQERGWIGRHPALFGVLAGFGGGSLIGYVPGDDAVLDDFTAGFNGLVVGGIGAGTGAAIGAFVGEATK